VPAPAVVLTIDQHSLERLRIRMAREEDGKKLKRELARNLRLAVDPALREIKASAREIPRSSAQPRQTTAASLGDAIANAVRAEVRMTGRFIGVRVKAKTTPQTREFRQAPRRINAKRFRHRVFGSDTWVYQVGKPGFFDDPLRRDRRLYREACRKAMADMANRLAGR
jgi:hypothetical protein